MIVSHSHKFIFIKTRKSAGTSIEVYLSQFCSDSDIVTPIIPHVEPHVSRNHRGLWNPIQDLLDKQNKGLRQELQDFVRLRKYYNHIPARVLKRRLPSGLWDEYFKFCVERNPWDKTLSHYHNLNKFADGQLTIDQYLANGDLCADHAIYSSPSGELMVDRVLRYEKLNEELDEVLHSLGVPFSGSLDVNAKSEHRRDKRSYRDVLTARQGKSIGDLFSTEIALHGYTY